MPRVGILALIQESNTFLPGTTTLGHFQQDLLLAGEDIRTQFANAHHEIRGFFDGLGQAGFEAVPLFAARTAVEAVSSSRTSPTMITSGD